MGSVSYRSTSDTVLAADGTTGTVDTLTVIDQSQTMHTLTVELAATYLVGAGQWVVHNYTHASVLIDNNILSSIIRQDRAAIQFAERYRAKLVIDNTVYGEGTKRWYGLTDQTIQQFDIGFVPSATYGQMQSTLKKMNRTAANPDAWVIASAWINQTRFATGDTKALIGALRLNLDARFFYFEESPPGDMSRIRRAYQGALHRLHTNNYRPAINYCQYWS